MNRRAWTSMATVGFLMIGAAPLQAGVPVPFVNWTPPVVACGGSNFETCASVKLESFIINDVHVIDLTVINLGTSGEVFKAVGLMGLPASGVTVSFTGGPAGWSAPANDLGGDGLIEVVYGAKAPSPAPQNGLAYGESGTFRFTFSRLLTQDELNALGGAAHAISGPGNCSTKLGVLVNGAVREGPYDPDCIPTNVVPEPLTMALLGTGLAGIAGVAHRRRREDEVETA